MLSLIRSGWFWCALPIAAGQFMAAGQDAGSLVGKRVLVKPGTELRSGPEPAEESGPSPGAPEARIFKVQQVRGGMALLSAETDPIKGWAPVSSVVRVEKAIEDLNQALKAKPADAAALLRRGTVLAGLGRIDEAIRDFSASLEADSRNPTAYLNRGNAWLTKNDLRQAIDDYSRALKLDPNHPLALLYRGRALMVGNNIDRAMDDFEKAIAADPDEAEGYRMRGTAHYFRRELDLALTDLDEALRREPASVQALYNRGLVHAARREPVEAIADFDEAIRIDPRNADAYNQRGSARHILGEDAKAIADYDQSLRFRPNDAHVLNNRAIAKAALGRFDAAQADIEQALKLAPHYTGALYHRAIFDLIAGRDAAAPARRLASLEAGRPNLAPYALMVAHLAARRNNKDGDARALLAEARKVVGKDWPSPIAAYLAGEIDADALLQAAIDEDQRTVARGFLGYDRLLRGDAAGARTHFDWIAEHGNRGFVQAIQAKAELDRLGPSASR
ncbi:MAG: tetratricopeptide repeat protein [Isosphaeraceae bacterium]